MPYKDKPTSMCSYGTKRKLSTALALIGKPSILLLVRETLGTRLLHNKNSIPSCVCSDLVTITANIQRGLTMCQSLCKALLLSH
jgi:hypothetical protein